MGRCPERQGLLEQDGENAWLERDPGEEIDVMDHVLGSYVPYPLLTPALRAPPETLPLNAPVCSSLITRIHEEISSRQPFYFSYTSHHFGRLYVLHFCATYSFV